MAARRTPSVCLFCQTRQATLGRRRTCIVSKRRLQTVALTPEDDGFLFTDKEKADGGKESPAISIQETMRQMNLSSPIDELREAALGFDALWKRRDLRLKVLRNLSNPFPGPPAHVNARHRVNRLPEAQAAPIPHETFRVRVREATAERPLRTLLRAQLLRAQWPKEILRIMSVAMLHKDTAKHLASLYEPIMRALYRCRENVSDPEVLQTLNQILWRFERAKLRINPALTYMALKFAARSRSLPAMKKYLKVARQSGLGISSNVFRTVIAKCSIGSRGLGEIRNGRWRRQELMQCLTGFDDAKYLPEDQQYHLGAFLNREDWQYFHGWIAVLARCRASDVIWEEWQTWKGMGSRTNPNPLLGLQTRTHLTTKDRGDLWFIEQMAASGDIKKSWQVLKESGIPFASLKDTVKDKLLDDLQHATVWDESVRDEMVRKYARDLTKIEAALGVKWVPREVEGGGQHELYMDQEEALEKLGEDGWALDQNYGYPWEEAAADRELLNAAEGIPEK